MTTDIAVLRDRAHGDVQRGNRSLEVLARQLHVRVSSLSTEDADLAESIWNLVPQLTRDEVEGLPASLRHWHVEVHNLVACILAHSIACPGEVPAQRRLPVLRSLLRQPVEVINQELAKTSTRSPSPFARKLAWYLLRFETHVELETIRIIAASRTCWLSTIEEGQAECLR
jgi:hypothetical protein